LELILQTYWTGQQNNLVFEKGTKSAITEAPKTTNALGIIGQAIGRCKERIDWWYQNYQAQVKA
jgi:hypothetical protein